MEGGGHAQAAVDAADVDLPVFQRLAEGLDGDARELGELVEEEDAAVGEGDLAGVRDRAAAIRAAWLMLWWGARKGRRVIKPSRGAWPTAL